MPQFDGTGPSGRGPLTGRGRGVCGSGKRNSIKKRNRGRNLFSLAIPAVSAVVTDICKPDSITRRLLSAVKTKLIGTGSTDKEVYPVDSFDILTQNQTPVALENGKKLEP